MFQFQAKTKFLAGPNAIQQLGSSMTDLGIDNVLVVTDQGLIKAGVYAPVAKILEEAGIKTAVSAALPLVIVVLIFQKQLVKGLLAGAVKG